MIKKIGLLAALLPVFFVFFFFIAVGGLLGAASEEEDAGGVGTMIPITFTGTVKGEDITLDASYGGNEVRGMKGTVNEKGVFTVNHSEGEGMQEMELPKSPPANLKDFSYMPQFDQSLYSYSLSKESAQYKLNQSCTTDERGYRKKGEAYLIALGSFYGSTIGDSYQLTFKQKDGSEKVIQAVLGDQKADKDTDAKHQYHKSDKSVVEFIMGTRSDANIQTIKEDFGTLVSIQKRGGCELALTGTIQQNAITITGTVDGITVTANGTVTNGTIHATGYIGNVTDGTGVWNGDVGEWKGGKLAWPLPGYTRITGAYGTDRGDHIHAGIDIGTQGTEGVPCVAADDGIVIKNVPLASGGARGHYIDIAHGSGLVTRYQHLAPGTGLAVGTQVKRGEKVAIAGGSGNGSIYGYAIHLHFEVLVNGTVTNPVPYLK